MDIEQLRLRRGDIIRVAAAHGAANVRVFGSVARGEADAASDIDVLVDVAADAQGFAYFGLIEDLRRALADMLECDVHVVDSAGLRRTRERILAEAVPL